MRIFLLRVCLGVACIIAADRPAGAGIIGGSSLLTEADLGSLAGALGGGPLDITNVFSHAPGDGETSADFHAAADGQGATFSVVEVLAGGPIARPMIVVGYDPSSWNSSAMFTTSTSLDDRTAFLLNLSSGVLQRQQLDAFGSRQTYNSPFNGPTFGGGHDLYTDSNLATGYANQYSFGAAGMGGTNILGQSGVTYFSIGRVEVFTVADAVVNPSAVPEPSSLGLLGVGAGSAGALGLRRRRRRA